MEWKNVMKELLWLFEISQYQSISIHECCKMYNEYPTFCYTQCPLSE